MAGARHVALDGSRWSTFGRDVDLAVVDEDAALAGRAARLGPGRSRSRACGRRRSSCAARSTGLTAAQNLCARLGIELTVRRFERKNPLEVVDAIPARRLARGRRADRLHAERTSSTIRAKCASSDVRPRRSTGRSSCPRCGDARPTGSAAARPRSWSPRTRSDSASICRSGASSSARSRSSDGISKRMLTPPEMRQIAGRAGRYGIHERGQVTTLDPKGVRILRAGTRTVRRLARGRSPIWISPTDEHLERLSKIIGTTRVGRLLQFFQTRVRRSDDENLRISDLSDQIEVASTLEMSDRVSLAADARPVHLQPGPPSRRAANAPRRLRALGRASRDGRLRARLRSDDGVERARSFVAERRPLASRDAVTSGSQQRFPDVYVDVVEATVLREGIDGEIPAGVARGRRTRTRCGAPRRNRSKRRVPPRFNKKKLPR